MEIILSNIHVSLGVVAVLFIILTPICVFVLSKIQMRAWLIVIDNHFSNKYKLIKNEKEDGKKEEE